MKIYIAGPMSGYPEFNFPAFFAAAERLKGMGVETVYNPAAKDEEADIVSTDAYKVGDDQALMQTGWDFRDAFAWDVDKVIYSDGIYMLKGWEASAGARGEHAVAVSMKQRYPDYMIMYEM